MPQRQQLPEPTAVAAPRPASARASSQIDAEIDDEIEFHLEMRTLEYVRQGMPDDAARAAALAAFGDLKKIRNACRWAKSGDAIMLARVQTVLIIVLLAAVVMLAYGMYTVQTANEQALGAIAKSLEKLVAAKPPSDPDDTAAQIQAFKDRIADQREVNGNPAGYEKFPYPIENIRGSIELSGSNSAYERALALVAAEQRARAPKVVTTVPEARAKNVDPATSELRVTFDKPMQDKSWSWVQISKETFPELDMAREAHYLEDQKTCVLPVNLAPGKKYTVWINSSRFQNFKAADGTPAVPYELTFETRK